MHSAATVPSTPPDRRVSAADYAPPQEMPHQDAKRAHAHRQTGRCIKSLNERLEAISDEEDGQ